ncbi:hypothetical protein HYU18_01025 [Candidatus Woesearchaeota archaeon]|nr:hypothetical protein [Candidatus Woesearchaeota archaeon]
MKPELLAIEPFVGGLVSRLATQSNIDTPQARHIVLNEWHNRPNPGLINTPEAHQAADKMLEEAIATAPAFSQRYSTFHHMQLVLLSEKQLYGRWPANEILPDGINLGAMAYVSTNNISLAAAFTVIGLIAATKKATANPLFGTFWYLASNIRNYQRAMDHEIVRFTIHLGMTYLAARQEIISSRQPQSSL